MLLFMGSALGLVLVLVCWLELFYNLICVSRLFGFCGFWILVLFTFWLRVGCLRCLGLFWCALGFALRVNCVYVYVGDCVGV